ncbi:MAG TPA: protein-glutamate O-methyltransferase [Geobacteraceae bacterium]
MTDCFRPAERIPRLSAGDFDRLSRFIRDACGITMPVTKKTMLEARLHKRLRALGTGSFADYCAYLFGASGGGERGRMIDLATTNKTDFFREADHFAFLAQRVLPEWVRGRGGAGRLTVWSAGCSSGEEPYTLAMVLNEFAAATAGFDYRIIATDISTRVLEKAALAVYPEERAAPIPLLLKRKYLLRSRERSEGLVRVVPELRQKVRFRHLNLMSGDFGIRERIDVIFCRNVMIYFDRATQERLLNRFCDHLPAGGYLFMGHSETLGGLDVPLTAVYPTVCRKPA